MDENPFPEAGFSKLFTEDESDSDSEQVKVQPAIIREGYGPLQAIDSPPLFVQISMLVFGSASLYSLGIIYSSHNYYRLKLAALDDISLKFPIYFTFANIPSAVISGFSCMILIKKVRLESMVWASYIIMLLLFALNTVLTKLDTHGYEMLFFITTQLTLIGMSVGAVVSTTALFALSAMMSPNLVKMYLVGQGLSQTLPVGLNILFTALPGFDVRETSCVGFGAGGVLVVAVMVLFYFFTVNWYVTPFIAKSIELSEMNVEDTLNSGQSKVIDLIPKAMKFGFVTFFLHFTTLSFYPGLMSLLRQSDKNSKIDEKLFLLVHMLAVVTVSDFMGKICAQFIKFPGKNVIVYFTLARVVLGLLLAMCNIQPRTIPVWFVPDWSPSLILFILGFTHGHLISLSYSFAPCVVENGLDKAVVSTIHHCCTFVGLLGGIGMSYLIQFLINL